ncbi:MAG: type II toxin-antitoxin system RelB/DinJ family antitoxin [Sutterella wadsworthensis]
MKEIKDTQITAQNVNFKIDPVVKESAESVLANMGLNMSAYIGMCLRQLAQDREIPFTQKADPGFWAAEYRTYKVKRIIDSGIIKPVLDLYVDLGTFINGIEGVIQAKLLSAELGGISPDVIDRANGMLGEMTFRKSLADVHVMMSMFLDGISKIESTNLEDIEPFTIYREAFESIDKKILDGCFEIAESAGTDLVELYETVFDIDRTYGEDFTITRETGAMLVVQLFDYAADAYNENPDSIVLRYTGQVGGSAVAALLSAATAARKMLSSIHLNVTYNTGVAPSLVNNIPSIDDKNKGGEQND